MNLCFISYLRLCWCYCVKFRLVFETTTKNGKKIQLKFHVPPSKHLGLVNFLKLAVDGKEDVAFTVEKVDKDKKELSKVSGTFKLTDTKSQKSDDKGSK